MRSSPSQRASSTRQSVSMHSLAIQHNTATGKFALYGNNNIALGAGAGASLIRGDDNIAIGNPANAHDSNTIRIGNPAKQSATFIAGISGVTVPAGVGVIVGTDGKLGTVVSSERFKDAIKPMDKASEAILALQSVTFRYKQELDPNGIPQFGLVAEEVAKVNPDLVARDDQGKPYTVRYEAVNAMLLNEFLKEHRKVEEQASINQKQQATIAQQRKDFERTMARQQKEIQALSASLKDQAARIQKVSDQVEVSKATPRLVVNDR